MNPPEQVLANRAVILGVATVVRGRVRVRQVPVFFRESLFGA